MKPIFTVHAGEFLVGDHIGREYQRVNVWVPTKDTGVDLLVSDERNSRAVSLQVKFSRDYPADMKKFFQEPPRACTWYTLKRQKIIESRADYWVFVLVGFAPLSPDFVIIKPSEVVRRFDAMRPPRNPEKIHSYLWVIKEDGTGKDRCWETRDLDEDEIRLIAQGQFNCPERDFTDYLNNWGSIKDLNV
jgi:hypothetical protein